MGTTWDWKQANAAWESAWSGLGVDVPPGLRERIAAAYAEPGRAYHNGQHLVECFGHFTEARDLLERSAEVALALWFHDAIYDPRRLDNEEQSAVWAQQELSEGGVGASAIDRIQDLVQATKHDSTPLTGDTAILIDIDLAILGVKAERFDEYEAQIRLEYAFVAEEVFRVARARVLESFLSRPSIYSTPTFRARFEARARANLDRSLGRLAYRPAGLVS